MSPPRRWAGAAAPVTPAIEQITQETSHGHRKRSAPIPRQGHTAPSGQLELRFGEDQRHSAAQRFEDPHRRNPVVYRTLVALAREWVRRTGQRKLGIATLHERARRDLALVTDDPQYRLNNDHKAYYARLIMKRKADLAGVFDLREAPEADAWIKQVAS